MKKNASSWLKPSALNNIIIILTIFIYFNILNTYIIQRKQCYDTLRYDILKKIFLEKSV